MNMNKIVFLHYKHHNFVSQINTIMVNNQTFFWLVTQSFLAKRGGEMRDEPKDCLCRWLTRSLRYRGEHSKRNSTSTRARVS